MTDRPKVMVNQFAIYPEDRNGLCVHYERDDDLGVDLKRAGRMAGQL